MPTLGQPGNQDRIEVGAGSVNRGGIAGWPRSKDQKTAVFGGFSHGLGPNWADLQENNIFAAKSTHCRALNQHEYSSLMPWYIIKNWEFCVSKTGAFAVIRKTAGI